MGDYKGQLSAQHYDERVANIRTDLGNLPSQSRTLLEQHDPGIIERLEVILDHLLVLTSTVSPEVVPTDRPQQLSSVLEDLKTNLGNLADPNNVPPQIPNIVASVNNLCVQLWSWQGSASGDDWKDSVTGAASTYRRSLGQQLVSFNSELDDLGARVTAAKQELERVKDAGEEFVSDTNNELESLKSKSAERLTALENQIETLNTQVTAAVARQDQAIQQYQEQFSKAQEKRSTDFAELMQTTRQSASEARDELDKNGRSALEQLQAQIDKAQEMVSVFAGAGTAHAFGKEAGDQAKDANKWRWYAIILAILGAAAAGVLILAFGNNKASVPEVVGKLAVTVVVAGAAGYAASQSAAHRKREVNNRRAELLLVSFEPFVRDLPTDEQDKARIALLQSLMTDTGEIASPDSKREPALTASELNLFKQFFDLITKR